MPFVVIKNLSVLDFLKVVLSLCFKEFTKSHHYFRKNLSNTLTQSSELLAKPSHHGCLNRIIQCLLIFQKHCDDKPFGNQKTLRTSQKIENKFVSLSQDVLKVALIWLSGMSSTGNPYVYVLFADFKGYLSKNYKNVQKYNSLATVLQPSLDKSYAR